MRPYKHITVSGCVISVHNIIPTFYSWFVLLAIISACFDLILGGGGGGETQAGGGKSQCAPPPPPSVCNPVYRPVYNDDRCLLQP